MLLRNRGPKVLRTHIGLTFEGKLVVVVHAELEDSIRIISARGATRQERKDYEQG
jgi:uncharacterized DUF497 family protein